MTHQTATLALLRDTENYLSALHGSVARHDHLAANLGCAGCELRDRITAELAAAPAVQAPTDRAAVPSAVVRKMLRRWAYAAGHIESELDDAVGRMYELITQDVLRRMADEAQPAPKPLLTLATPCAVCTHPYNWHQGGICQAGPEENRCGCIAFAPGAQDGAQP
jgi:hypothetical protein